jgi:hypothetical protein
MPQQNRAILAPIMRMYGGKPQEPAKKKHGTATPRRPKEMFEPRQLSLLSNDH